MLEPKVRKLIHQFKVVVLEAHVLPDVHQLYLPFNQCPLGPLRQLPLRLGRRPLDLVQEREVEPLVEEVADGQLLFDGLRVLALLLELADLVVQLLLVRLVPLVYRLLPLPEHLLHLELCVESRHFHCPLHGPLNHRQLFRTLRELKTQLRDL